MAPDDRQISRYLSLVLRHDPGAAGVVPDAGGGDIGALLAGATVPLSRDGPQGGGASRAACGSVGGGS